MLGSLARKVFGTSNDRLLRSFQPQVAAINALAPAMEKFSDDALKAQTDKLRARLKDGETLNDILPEAFATVREAAWRTLRMKHFDVQLIGGMVLHKGMISEMKTGEGKTLVATLAVYLNALEGKGVHVVTVNDYLAKRDSEWMGQIYKFLGLSVGVIVHELDDTERQRAYASDVTYGTNNEFGFDYLRDNMKYALEQMVQRPFNFAIVDEVDSILIDEARTPLIISGPTEDNSELYAKIDKLIPKLAAQDSQVENATVASAGTGYSYTHGTATTSLYFDVDEKAKTVTLTEDGVQKMEELLKKEKLIAETSGLYDMENVAVVHHVNQALKAHKMFTRDVDYIVKDNKVIIIDEFTGRMMEGRRYSDGLHQALEAKEHVHIQNENQTLASITFQNYFRLYPKLAGMTGTALTEANEFRDIYGLEVVEIPTHMPVSRVDHDDEIYRTAKEKYAAVIALIKECQTRNQPTLVGTVSIEKSEYLSTLLKKEKIPHQVLNARYHEQEALIIAQAGRPGAVTIATNMAGRGTDIMLGGNPEMRVKEEMAKHTITSDVERSALEIKLRNEVTSAKEEVLKSGGLFVIGTERHESRRIDNQLRGRSGRQGDPGASKFFISFEDDLMRIFGGERMEAMTAKLGMKEGDAITHRWMTRAIEKAQQRVEARNYDIRKNLLKFDDVMNDQRKVIFEQRIDLMRATDVSETVKEMREEIAQELVARHIPKDSYAEQWDTEGLEKDLFRVYGLHLQAKQWAAEEGIADEEILTRINETVESHMVAKEQRFTPEIMRIAEKRILLQTLDQLWKDHLLSLDHLRHGINLRAYGQRDPLNEYKQEAFTLFEHLLYQLREAMTQRMAHLEVRIDAARDMGAYKMTKKMHETRNDPALAGAQSQQADRVTPIRTHVPASQRDPNDPSTWGKVSRNDVCPCGSGAKYKHCHGKLV